MLKLLKYLFFGVVLVLCIGFFLPGSAHIERSVQINAPVAAVFNQVNELKNWGAWSPWHKLDPNTKWVFSDPSSGLGAWYTWSSEKKEVGSGKVAILNAESNKDVRYKMEFSGAGEAVGDFKTVAVDSLNTTATWTFDMDYGANPIMRWMGFAVMGKAIGADYDKGLANMKDVCEKK